MDIINIDSEHVRKIREDGDRVVVHFRGRPDSVVLGNFLKSEVNEFAREYCGGGGGGLGQLLYKVGLVSDVHYDYREVEDPTRTQTYYENDLANALAFFERENVLFIACAGDIATYNNEDLAQATSDFMFQYLPDNGYGLLSCLGNHDVLQVYGRGDREHEVIAHAFRYKTQEYVDGFEVGMDDGSKWTEFELPDGNTREHDGVTYQDLPYSIAPNTIMYDASNVHFCAFDDNHTDIATWFDNSYTPAGNCGISLASRTSYYWIHPDSGDMFLFLSPHFGPNRFNGSQWYVHATNLLDFTDPYVMDLQYYVADSGYVQSNYDYRFYDPRTLLWLKQVLEDADNAGRRIFIFSHFFFPHKTGNGRSDASGTGWYYTKGRLQPYAGNDEQAVGLCGLELFFLNKLNRQYKNTVWFTGHSHFVWEDEAYDPYLNFCNQELPMYLLDSEHQDTDRVYSRLSDTPVDDDGCAMNVHLPSLSKPTTLSYGTEELLPFASEGGMLEVYENGVWIRPLIFRHSFASVYTNCYYGDGRIVMRSDMFNDQQ